MTKRQFSLLLGLVGQTGCLIYDEPLHRPSSDLANDASGDATSIRRDVASDALRSDGVTADAEVNREASQEAGAGVDVAPTEDARDSIDSRDATVDVPAEASTDHAADVTADDGDSDGDDGSGRDGGGGGPSDAALDAAGDPPIVGCTVDFTVSGVTWDDDGPSDATADGGSRVVRLVGDSFALGSWESTLGLSMTEKAPGAWFITVTLRDALAIEFKFVKLDSGRAPEWESWNPFNSNRSLLVDCSAEGGTIWIDASSDAGPANRAVGRSYGGAFGTRPFDATK